MPEKIAKYPVQDRKKLQEMLAHVGIGVENAGSWMAPRIDKVGHSLSYSIEKAAPKIKKSLNEVRPRIIDTVDHAAPKVRDYLSHTVPDFVKNKEKTAAQKLSYATEKFKQPKLSHKKGYGTEELVNALIAEFGMDRRRLKRHIKKLSKTAARAARQAKLDTKKLKNSRSSKGWLLTCAFIGISVGVIFLKKSMRPTVEEKSIDKESKWKTPTSEETKK